MQPLEIAGIVLGIIFGAVTVIDIIIKWIYHK